jgi:hypothetical protein
VCLFMCADRCWGEYAAADSVSQRDRKIYALDADMPQQIRRFLRPGATETAVLEAAVWAVSQRHAGPHALKSGLLKPVDVQELAGSERRS